MSKKPNIIYILADDMGYGDVSCLNRDSRIVTPHLDKLGAGGMVFRDTHASSSVCPPSRYSILTGRSTPGDRQENTGGSAWAQLGWMLDQVAKSS